MIFAVDDRRGRDAVMVSALECHLVRSSRFAVTEAGPPFLSHVPTQSLQETRHVLELHRRQSDTARIRDYA